MKRLFSGSHTRASAAAVALALLVAVGCGGGDDDSGPSKADIVKDTDEICVEAIDEARRYTETNPPPKDAASVGRSVDETVRIAEGSVDRFEALKPPDDGQADYERFLDGQTAALAANKDLARQARSGTPAQFAQTGRGLRELGANILRAGEAYGLEEAKKCAAIVMPFSVPDPGEETATAPGTRNTDGITGSWKGEGSESGPGGTRRRYPVEITISSLAPGGEAGRINYPSFPCSGPLRLDEKRGETYVFDELIRTGRRRCELDGRVELRRDGERLSYRWSTAKTKGLTVRGLLEAR